MARLARWLPVVAVAVFTAAPSWADGTKAECLAANLSAQSLRRDGKLRATREQLRLCANPRCPAMVRDDCAQRMDELERAQPSVVFEVKDATGADVTGVRVSMDGRLLADRLDGTALPVDPGSHEFVFAAAGQTSVTRTLFFTEGAKGRREGVVLGGGMGRQRVVAIVLGAAGLAGIVVGVTAGALAWSAEGAQESDCGSPTSCPRYPQALADHRAGSTDGAISTVGFVAGPALAGAAVLLYVTGRPSSPAAGVGWLLPAVGPVARGLVWSGTF
jgi:hypothetical protein